MNKHIIQWLRESWLVIVIAVGMAYVLWIGLVALDRDMTEGNQEYVRVAREQIKAGVRCPIAGWDGSHSFKEVTPHKWFCTKCGTIRVIP